MGNLPSAEAHKTNGNLGRLSPREDGITLLVGTGVAVTDKIVLGEVLGPFYQIADAEAKGINEAYDTTNKSLMWHHIKDFYTEGVIGTELYVIVFASTVTMTEMVDIAEENLVNGLFGKNGRVRLLGVTRTPGAGYTPTYDGQFDKDVFDAVAKAQALAVYESEHYRPIDIYIEGRAFQGTIASTKNCRDKVAGCNANAVTIWIGSDPVVSALDALYAGYANLGVILGRSSAIPVMRNSGRVKSGALILTEAGLSNGVNISALKEADFETLYNNGYAFPKPHPTKAGLYIVDDSNACPIDDDYAFKSNSRTMNKAIRLAIEVYVNEILDEIDVDATTGKLTPEAIKDYERLIEKKIEDNMINIKEPELKGITAYVDPDQDVLALDKIELEANLVKKGTLRKAVIYLGFVNNS